ncbi:MAG: 50S ribosomal protein L9 [Planctomycetota bacterium]|nr:MAG: 50S ribosomal protein L9 [Planctomycetota bacterium]
MRLLLRDTVEGLGVIGDVVDVKPGYARNYLLPAGLAVAVTPDNLLAVERRKQQLLAEERARKAELEKIGKDLEGKRVTVRALAGEEGKLYGSVGAAQIAQAFADEGYPVSEKAVLIAEPIKELGVYEVQLKLHKELEPVTAKVWVVEEKPAATS